MATFAGVALWLLALPAFLINLYFLSLVLDLWPGLRRRLSALFRACRADTSTCAVVAATPYARLFGGLPNVTAGIPWCLALAVLATAWLVSGRLFVPVPFLVVSLVHFLCSASHFLTNSTKVSRSLYSRFQVVYITPITFLRSLVRSSQKVFRAFSGTLLRLWPLAFTTSFNWCDAVYTACGRIERPTS